MPARVHKIRHDAETRAKIQAAMIINRLQDCVAGKIELDSNQVSCARILLSKTLPDLSQTTIEGGENPVQHVFTTIYEAKPEP
jgi:hypothetical protein